MKAYKNKYTIEPIELCNDDGSVAATVHALTDYISMRNRLVADLGKLQRAQEDHTDDETVGRLIMTLIADLYGDDGASKMVEYYEGDESAMVNVVMQHIYADVQPALERIAAERVQLAKKARKKSIFGRR